MSGGDSSSGELSGERAPLAAIVLSGGMDSTTLLAHYADAGYRLLAVSVDYGQRHVRELDAAQAVAHAYDADFLLVDVPGLGAVLEGSALTDANVDVPEGHYAEESMRRTIVPNRNAVLINLAAAAAMAAGAEVIAVGVHAGDHWVYPDCRPAAIGSIAAALAVCNEGLRPPRLEAPFIEWSKAQIAAHGHTLGAPLYLTWSCYVGGRVHCGRCGTCQERREAFVRADVPDPTDYADPDTVFAAPAGVS
jgi:7-cyano-7-deazaguanine synthase